VLYFIDDIKLLMLKLVSIKIDTYLTSLWRHERYLFSVFRGILPAIFRRFSKKISNACTEFFSWLQCTQTVFKINTIIYRNISYLLMNYVFNVIVTSWALFVFCISWNFARDISTVFEKNKHLRTRKICYQIIKIYHRFSRQRLLLKHQNVI
jgi:hypothetical protein